MSETEKESMLEKMILSSLGAMGSKLPNLADYDPEVSRVLVDSAVNWIYSQTNSSEMSEDRDGLEKRDLLSVIDFDGVSVRRAKVEHIITGRGVNPVNNKPIKIIYVPEDEDISSKKIEENFYLKEFDCLPQLAIFNTAVSVVNKFENAQDIINFARRYGSPELVTKEFIENVHRQFDSRNIAVDTDSGED